MLEMMWQCDGCRMENTCKISKESHFFSVILLAKRDHESISPSCKQNGAKIRSRILHLPTC